MGLLLVFGGSQRQILVLLRPYGLLVLLTKLSGGPAMLFPASNHSHWDACRWNLLEARHDPTDAIPMTPLPSLQEGLCQEVVVKDFKIS